MVAQVSQKSILNPLYRVTQNALLQIWVALKQLFISTFHKTIGENNEKIYIIYIYPEDGKRLTENGKDAGVLVIAPESKDLSTFSNVKEIKKVVEYIADEGKVFRNKTRVLWNTSSVKNP